jgi:hypothetical protein
VIKKIIDTLTCATLMHFLSATAMANPGIFDKAPIIDCHKYMCRAFACIYFLVWVEKGLCLDTIDFPVTRARVDPTAFLDDKKCKGCGELIPRNRISSLFVLTSLLFFFFSYVVSRLSYQLRQRHAYPITFASLLQLKSELPHVINPNFNNHICFVRRRLQA